MSFIDIKNETLTNDKYRKILFTSRKTKNLGIQIAIMSLKKGQDIPLEQHEGYQYIVILKGTASALVNKTETKIKKGESIMIPPKTKHYIKNIGRGDLKLYTIYVPPEH